MKNTPPEIIFQQEAGASLPSYESAQAAGADVRALLNSPITIEPRQRAIVKTGLKVAIPEGYEIQVRPRSGLAAKHGVTVLNTPGTIDADYRGEIMVILLNTSDQPFTVESGMRVAQLVVAPALQAQFISAEELSTTARGEQGFGHTGLN